jgi:hypothetical protein
MNYKFANKQHSTLLGSSIITLHYDLILMSINTIIRPEYLQLQFFEKFKKFKRLTVLIHRYVLLQMGNLNMFEVMKLIFDSLVSFGPVGRPCGFEYWPNHDMVLTSTLNKGVTIYSQSS